MPAPITTGDSDTLLSLTELPALRNRVYTRMGLKGTGHDSDATRAGGDAKHDGGDAGE